MSSTQSSPDIDDRLDREASPAQTDPFVRGLSQAIGGPIGEHAVRSGGGRAKFWSAARIVLALCCLTLALHWVQKTPCQTGDWQKNVQYNRFCYTDVVALYYSEQLNLGQVPYKDHPVEYPVLIGYVMGATGLPTHELAERYPQLNQATLFYTVNTIVLGSLAIATVGLILGLRRRRPWDAAIFALSPILFLSATVNWDFVAIGLGVAGLYAWAKRRPVWAGILIGLGGSAKLWPLFIVGPLLVLALRSQRVREWTYTMGAVIAAWVALNAPVFFLYRNSWNWFWTSNFDRAVDWGTIWYVGRYLDSRWNTGAIGDQGPFQWLSDRIPLLNNLWFALFFLACVAIGALALLAPRRPRVAQLVFLVVAMFLLFSKVWSQQYVLWLLPLIVLARPRWGAIMAWSVSEVAYMAAFYAELLGIGGKPVIPEGTFVFAAALRLITLIVLIGLVVREVWRPELDPVRQTYSDDPDGGPVDGAPDAPWIATLRESFGLTKAPEREPEPVSST